MRKRILIIFLLCLSFVFSFDSILKAESTAKTNELQEGRYVIAMQTGRGIKNTRIPALVLDSYRGIIWTCQNLQDGRPLWVMVDLARNGNVPMTKKKYVVRMLEWQDADLRMPAMVMDVEDGIIWTCPNIIDGKATWLEKKLNESLIKAN